ncbi:MAG: hypothetical protein GC193_12055 [Cryomorphaceae bacterium]|nr:hypothetical protein [Cryomorphaceae bacterium]
MKQLFLFCTGLLCTLALRVEAQTCVYVCPSQGLTTEFEWIRFVDFDGGLSNFSGNNGGYADFGTTFGGVYTAGNTYSYTAVPGYGDGPFTETWRGWMDFNQDGDFDDDGELILSNFFQGPVSGTFSIPPTANNGLTRLRVAMSFAIVPGCGDFPEGEVEDYCVTVSGGVDPVCDATSPVTGLASSVSPTGVSLTWSPVVASLGCQVSGGPVPSFTKKVRQLGSNVSSISIPTSILAPGTYNWKVNCACSITPVLDLTPDSAVDTFNISGPRLASVPPFQQASINLTAVAQYGQLNLSLQSEAETQQLFLVTDMLGRTVCERMVNVVPGVNYVELDIAALNSGLYLVAVQQNQLLLESVVISIP